MRRRDPSTAGARNHLRTGVHVGLCAALVFALAPVTVSRAAKRTPIPVAVSIDETRPGTPIPREFLGLSFELSSLAQMASYAEGGDLVTMLR
jgi:hypothetical protein